MYQPTLTVDLDAVARNWQALDRLSGSAETAAAVKADAYGLGVDRVAPRLAEAGCRSFFVATPPEGERVRAILGAEPDIYVLNGVGGAEAAPAREARLIPCLNHPGQIDDWRAAGGGACALQLDTGMSRLGLQPSELEGVPEDLAPVLVMSHLACADEPDHPANAAQRAAFEEMRARWPEARHSLAATGGTLLDEAYRYDLVRCGIGLYGGLPFEQAAPVAVLTAPVLQLRDLPPGASVGYGWTWTTERPSRIATLPLGYADGLLRAASNSASVFIEGRRVPVAGRVSMDLLGVDVTGVEGVRPGTPVEVLGPNQTVDDLAQAAGTIGYEVLTSLGSRYARCYTDAHA